jgi:hypothetical protein
MSSTMTLPSTPETRTYQHAHREQTLRGNRRVLLHDGATAPRGVTCQADAEVYDHVGITRLRSARW